MKMPTIRTLDGGTRTETMPDSNSAHEPPAYSGPQAPMSLREIAEAFVKHEDADVVGVIEELLRAQSGCGDLRDEVAYNLAFDIIDFVEAQNEG